MRRATVARASRWVWLVNGILLLALVVGTGVAVLVGWATSRSPEPTPAGQEPVRDSLARPPARVRFDAPEVVQGSDTRLMLVREGRGLPTSPMSAALAPRAAGTVVDVAFLDPDGRTRLLFDRPTRVLWVSFPGAPEWMTGPLAADPAQRFIAYVAATADTDGDGTVDLGDDPRLLLSSLEGAGLRDVLPAGHRFESMRALRPGLLLVLAEQGRGAGSRQRAFLFSAESGALTAYAALDSLAERVRGR